jgi:hypothetical protein
MSPFDPISELRETKLNLIHRALREAPFHVSRNSIFLLKLYLRPKPRNDSLPSNAAHIGIILNDRLEQERSVVQQHIQLDTVLAAMPAGRKSELRLFLP